MIQSAGPASDRLTQLVHPVAHCSTAAENAMSLELRAQLCRSENLETPCRAASSLRYSAEHCSCGTPWHGASHCRAANLGQQQNKTGMRACESHMASEVTTKTRGKAVATCMQAILLYVLHEQQCKYRSSGRLLQAIAAMTLPLTNNTLCYSQCEGITHAGGQNHP